jgi:hypothetical protein
VELFIEESIVNAVKNLLLRRVNELLGEMDCPVPSVEFGDYRGGSVVVPVVSLAGCERSEKERIIRVDVYSVTVVFVVPESGDVERYCYAYAAVVDRALRDDPALGGVADRAVVSGKKYVPPKCPGTGGDWKLVLSVRVMIEGTINSEQ